MIRTYVQLLAAPILLAGCTAPSAAPPARQPASAAVDAKAELLRTERRWLDAYEQRDAAAMDSILADEFTIAYPGGRTMDKAAVMAQLRQPGPSDIRFSTEVTEVRVAGDSATLTGIFVMQSPRGMRRSRYTDEWVRRDGRWQVVSSRLSSLSSG